MCSLGRQPQWSEAKDGKGWKNTICRTALSLLQEIDIGALCAGGRVFVFVKEHGFEGGAHVPLNLPSPSAESAQSAVKFPLLFPLPTLCVRQIFPVFF